MVERATPAAALGPAVWHREYSHAAYRDEAATDPAALAAWHAADRALLIARDELGLSDAWTVRWLRCATPAEAAIAELTVPTDPGARFGRLYRKAPVGLSGWHWQTESALGRFVLIAAGQTPESTAVAVGHELRHAWQAALGLDPCEDDAEQFGRTVAARLT
jgi:hypothetical protein